MGRWAGCLGGYRRGHREDQGHDHVRRAALLLEALSFIVDFHRDDTLLEFLQVRRILEPAATAMAAERISEEESKGLRATVHIAGVEQWLASVP